jgi:hypothetical protein
MINKNFLIGITFMSFHMILVYGAILIALFSNDFFVLYSLGIIILIVLFLNHLYGDCPLSAIEEHHLGFNMVDYGNNMLPIKYDKKRRPEVTLQWIFMGLVIVLIKIVALLFMKTIKEYSLINKFIKKNF